MRTTKYTQKNESQGSTSLNPHEGFEEFWRVYPRKVDKRQAVKAFDAALKRAPARTIIDGAIHYAIDPNREDQYTKYPATWLNADAWDNGALPDRTPRSPMPMDDLAAIRAAGDRLKAQADAQQHAASSQLGLTAGKELP